jgi:membrane protease YdiL (CAAX protease family)
VRRFFFTTAGTLRAPWRLLVFILAYLAASLVVGAILGPLLGGSFRLAGLRGQTIATLVEMIAALLATWLVLRNMEKKPWSDVGLHREATSLARLGIGLIVGSGAITLAIIALIATGWLDRTDGTATTWGGPLLRMTLLLLPAAFYEELIARGYIFSAIRDGAGTAWAVAITSSLFGLLHMQNPGANVQSVMIVALAGVFLAAVRIGTDSLYAAAVAHFAFNWVMAALFHVPVSGYAFEYPGYRYVDAGPDWATGGGWGPEIGVPSAVTMIVGSWLVFRWRTGAASRRADEPFPASRP